jgi:DnaJ-class molecular chaperone
MRIELDDLIEKCITCGGSGENQQSSGSESSTGYGQRRLQVPISNTCETCEGTGRVKLTESGEALLRFIQIMKR